MSGKLMGELFKRQLTQTQLVVALALADHAKDDGTDVFPGVGYVAWKVDKSRRQVRRIMRELEALGMLVKVAEAQRHRPTEYSIDVEALEAKPPRADIAVSPLRTSRADIAVSPLRTIQGGHLEHLGRTFQRSRADIAVSARADIQMSP